VGLELQTFEQLNHLMPAIHAHLLPANPPSTSVMEHPTKKNFQQLKHLMLCKPSIFPAHLPASKQERDGVVEVAVGGLNVNPLVPHRGLQHSQEQEAVDQQHAGLQQAQLFLRVVRQQEIKLEARSRKLMTSSMPDCSKRSCFCGLWYSMKKNVLNTQRKGGSC
jgi:hypothetical protein